MDHNLTDPSGELLREFRVDNQKFLEYCQPLVGRAVGHFVRTGAFARLDYFDTCQDTLLRLLERSDHIISRYEGRASFRNYLCTVIMNYCRVKVRTRILEGMEPLLHDQFTEARVEQVPRNLLRDEFLRLERFLDGLKRKKGRFILCLKMMYRIPISLENIREFDPDIPEEDILMLFRLNEHRNVCLKDKDLFAYLTPMVNRRTGKHNTVDAIRKWVDLKVRDMILHMNGNPPVARYSRESIQILVEKYFMEFKQNPLFPAALSN